MNIDDLIKDINLTIADETIDNSKVEFTNKNPDENIIRAYCLEDLLLNQSQYQVTLNNGNITITFH